MQLSVCIRQRADCAAVMIYTVNKLSYAAEMERATTDLRLSRVGGRADGLGGGRWGSG